MGKSAKKIIGVAVAIAVPFVAPKIVTALASSAMLKGTAIGAALGTTTGATVGSALVGAGLGAAGAKVTGGDPRLGALFGGIGGGFAGYNAITAPGMAVAPGTAEALGPAGLIPGSETAQILAAQDAATFGTAGLQGVTTSPQLAQLAAADPSAYGAGAQIPGTPGGGPAPGGSFMDAVAKVPGEVAAKFSDPKILADMTLRAGAALLGDAMAGDGLSDEEQQLLNAQVADLKALRERDEELFKIKLEEAMGLIGEARYFNPEQFGLQAQARVQVAGAQQQREAQRAAALQPGRGGYSAADERRAGLDVTARGQTAYLQGAEGAQRQRMAGIQAGLAALPSSPTGALQYSSGLMTQYQKAMDQAAKARRDAGGFFGDIFGVQVAGQRGDDRNTIG